MPRFIYHPNALIAALPTADTRAIKKILSEARAGDSPGRTRVAAAAQAELERRDLCVSVAATHDDGLPRHIVEQAWEAVFFCEAAVTAQNPIGKNGRRKMHRLSRTREMIKRWGVKGALERIESKDSERALFNMQVVIRAGRPDLLWEEIVLRNAQHFDPHAVNAIYAFALKHFGQYGLTPTNPHLPS
jgi:hypothetical protein